MSPLHPFDSSLEFAREEDLRDPLRDARNRFHHPMGLGGRPVVYLTGNSLGLQPLDVEDYVDEVIRAWQDLGVDGHFRGENPWLQYMDSLVDSMARIVGARPREVTIMNALTVNIHLLLASFYNPTASRFKICMEADAFPSDRYAVRSHLRLRGFDPEESIIMLAPRPGEHLLRQDDIERVIHDQGDSIALVFLGGLNYYTGQLLDLAAIAQCSRNAGCMVGFDLAHAAGNVSLQLHAWDIDFAAWCTYKYLNAGPGSPGGVFIHDRHLKSPTLPALKGWWGQSIDTRFKMLDDYEASPDASAYQISNPSILSLAPLKASLVQFEKVGLKTIVEKSDRLTGYLEYLIVQEIIQNIAKNGSQRDPGSVEILTPADPKYRGAQLSVKVENGRRVFDYLRTHDVLCDWREPGVIRISPAPLYNTFMDARHAVEVLAEGIELGA